MVRLCVGGNRLEYNGGVHTSTVDITTVRLSIDGTISTKRAKYMTGVQKTLFWHTCKNIRTCKIL